MIHNLVEDNGKTIKENNLEKSHNIPIGTLVEYVNADSPNYGIRLFVCTHTRDCDGTPLYSLTEDLEEYQRRVKEKWAFWMLNCFGGYSEEYLKIITKPNNEGEK